MDKKSKITIITSVIALAIVTIITTYAYFSARITGLESASTISLTAGTMGIHYAEGNETVTVSNIYPKSDPWVTKTFTLTGNNTTTLPMEYEVGLQIITNTFKGGQLSFSLEVGNNNDGTSMAAVTNKSIVGSNRTMKIGSGSFPGPTTNGVQTYTLKIYFLDSGKDQNINQGAVFNGKITVSEKVTRVAAVNECTDTAHTTLTQGDEYVNGQYTYRYKQSGTENSWENINEDGWGVKLTDKGSNDDVTSVLCTSINGKSIVSMASMFEDSVATTIDTSSFDTSHVINMRSMFFYSEADTLDLSTFDTSNVTNMSGMFGECYATSINISSFDTSNVTNMESMFYDSAATTLDLSSFDTSSVTTMSGMFSGSQAASIDLSTFDTSNVTDMSAMFYYSEADVLDLSNFDTSKVTDMYGMFYRTNVTSLDLSTFDTSSVTNMQEMFGYSAVITLDLSSFDTSNVTNMSHMFASSSATTGYARTQADANRFNSVAGSLSNGGDPGTLIPNTLSFVVK